jgi:hypothetical protein
MLSTKLKEAAGNSADATLYVDDVFSTYLYTGNGSTQTITNGIDLAGMGGMTWIKSRSAATGHKLTDTTRGATKALISNTTGAETTDTTGLTAFSSTGFSLGASSVYNTTATTYASWTFREAAKFFDVVTYTGTGANRNIAHNLGSVPGCIIVKRTDTAGDWQVYHRSLLNTEYIVLNTTAAKAVSATRWNSTTPTSSVFSLGTDATVNASGGTYVAYIYAHNAGGFGSTGAENVISCGVTSSTIVNLGYEPQWILFKRIDGASDWYMCDTMRGITYVFNGAYPLLANSGGVESNTGSITPITNGFQIQLIGTYIYMAIRIPNKPPTSGTQVFGLNARAGTDANATVTGGQTDDAVLIRKRQSSIDVFSSRLTGTGYLETSSTAAEIAASTAILQANPWDVMDGVKVGTISPLTNAAISTYINYFFKRAPGFFDVVCYTGTGSATTQAHNLTVVPELMIVKSRSGAASWYVYHRDTGNTSLTILNAVSSLTTGATHWNSTTPTNTVFSIGAGIISGSVTYIAYLFATLAGISNVGSYTGNGTSQNIECGFAAGARFFLVKATSTAGSWWVWDSARGITSGNDPALQLNSTAAEITTADAVDPYSPGITVNQEATCSINASGVSYIFLAIA